MGIPGAANPLLLASASGYQIERSLRFNSADSAYLNRTPASAGNRKTWTWAGWVKRSGNFGSNQALLYVTSPNNNAFRFEQGTGNFRIFFNAATDANLETRPIFRDPSAWYHFVLAVDTTQATPANRIKLYVNGSQVTTFLAATYPTQNYESGINSNVVHNIASRSASDEYFNGYLADIHFIDGQALTPSSFGETDDNGVWQPKAYTGTYGTNGFHLPFSDNSTAAALGTDTSGNGNTWTVNNLNTFSGSGNSIYSPPLGFSIWTDTFETGVSSINYSNSNKTATATNLSEKSVRTVTAKSSGKWYIEFMRSGDVRRDDDVWGLAATTSNYPGGGSTGGVGSTHGRNVFNDLGSGTSLTPGIPVYSAGAVCQLAVDFDAKKVWWGVDNAWSSNGNPSTGNSPTFSNWTGSPTWYAIQRLYFNTGASSIISGYAPITSQNDSLVDSPTSYGIDTGIGGEVRGNYATFNPLSRLYSGTASFLNGNLEVVETSSAARPFVSTIAISAGKFYWEITKTAGGTSDNAVGVLPASQTALTTVYDGLFIYYKGTGERVRTGTAQTSGASWGVGDIIGVALNMDDGQISFYKNGVLQVGAITGVSTTTSWLPYCGDDTSATNTSWLANFGQRPFAYTAPSGFKALCTQNLPEGTITTSGTFTGNANADGPFVYLNGVPTAMTINGNAVTFATHADKLSNGFKLRTNSGSYNTSGSNTYSVSTTGSKFKYARAQPNP